MRGRHDFFNTFLVALFAVGVMPKISSALECRFVDGERKAFGLELRDDPAPTETDDDTTLAWARAQNLPVPRLEGAYRHLGEAYLAIEVLQGAALSELGIPEWDVKALDNYVLSASRDDLDPDLGMHLLLGGRDGTEFIGAYGAFRGASFVCPRPTLLTGTPTLK